MLVSSIQGAEIAPIPAKTAADTQKSAATASIQPFYFSPALVIDPKSGTDVLEYRNTSTGAVTNQYPSEKDIKAYTQSSVAAPVQASAQPVVAKDTKPAEVASPPAQQQPTAAVSSTAVVV